MGSGAKSYMRKGFLICTNAQIFSPYMRRSLVIYDPLNSLIYEENCIFFFISVGAGRQGNKAAYGPYPPPPASNWNKC